VPEKLFSPETTLHSEEFVKAGFANSAASEPNPKATWSQPTPAEFDQGIRVWIHLQKAVKQVTWHRKGDYFATVAPDANNSAVLIHQLTKHQTQQPFKKNKGAVQRVMFHPNKPMFFVATQRYVRQYNLQRQELVKTMQTGVKWISSLDIHPAGDNLIIGSYDKRLCWFDLDLSSKPYKTLRYHQQAIRSVAYHKRYPLFASCADDGNVQVFHGMVYNDLLQNPLIVPVKILKNAHERVEALGRFLGPCYCSLLLLHVPMEGCANWGENMVAMINRCTMRGVAPHTAMADLERCRPHHQAVLIDKFIFDDTHDRHVPETINLRVYSLPRSFSFLCHPPCASLFFSALTPLLLMPSVCTTPTLPLSTRLITPYSRSLISHRPQVLIRAATQTTRSPHASC